MITQRYRLLLSFVPWAALLAAHAHAQTNSPQLTSWYTQNSGKYARAYTSTANRTSGNASTTWTNHSAIAYADVYEVSYSNNWVYAKYTGLPSYNSGPWLNPQGAVSNFWPETQAGIRRFPRNPVVQSGTKDSTSAGYSGMYVNGVAIFNSLDGQAWTGSAIQGQAPHTQSTYYWHRNAPVAESFNFDYGMGHQTPAGIYHTHQNPLALRYQLGDHVNQNASSKLYSESAVAVTQHSPILGWAHDGYPVYGPYGYSTATNASSGIRRMVSGYTKRDGTNGADSVTANPTVMPAWYARYRQSHFGGAYTTTAGATRSTDTGNYPVGTFAQDFSYLGDLGKTQGTDFDLDEYNGRYCVTPEYPGGTYAYFITIDSSNNSAYPYTFAFEFYGDATGGSVASISETVTNYFTGGPNTPLAIPNTPTVNSGTVSLTWNSVEGGTYSVEASTDQTNWTTKATGLAATDVTKSTTYTALSSGMEYTRVQRTALATYDTTGVGTATVAQSTTKSFYAGNNAAPTLTSINTLTGATEDAAYTISYATLAAAADEADSDATTPMFRIEAVSSGTLTKGGVAVTAGTTTLATGESLVWTPAGNANGSLAAFTVKAWDGIVASTTAVPVNVNVTAVNDAPILTSISTLTGATQDAAFTISYSDLASVADEADAEGDAISFRIEAVSSGTLKKNGVSITAGTTLIGSADSVVWTPASGASGTLAAFTVKAYDGASASSSAVPVNVSVASTTSSTDPQLASWYTAQTGKYARITETDASSLAGTSVTTWTRTTGPFTLSQSQPVYAGPQQIDYSNNWVYLRTPSLATYTMGPWYDNAARSALFVNVPKNQGLIVRFPRTSTLGSIPTTKTRTQGFMVNGVLQPACGYFVDGVCVFDPTDGFSYANGTESSPGTGAWHRDAYINESITFDKSFAHQQNTGTYHNHANPYGLRYQLGDNVTFNNTTKAYAEGNTANPSGHSPILGWMLDGLPLYGPYGYSSAMNPNSGVRRMIGGFVKRDGTTTGVDNITSTGRTVPAWSLRNGEPNQNGPAVSSAYPLGRYIEDWAYLGDLQKNAGVNYQLGVDFDLNEYNVRYCVTPEFPNGTWAYFLNVTSAGTPQFPYMINRWFYRTPTGSTVTSISETVTNTFIGGANRPLEITQTNATASNVTLTWNAVEGGTYSVDASTNNSTWTNKASGLTVSAANSKSNSHTPLGTQGTEYARVNRTALATYDSTGTAAATVSQTRSTSVTLPGNAPTLTSVSTLAGAMEDTPFSISYADLAAAANEADADAGAISFRIEAVPNGVLTKNGVAITAGITLLSSGETLIWQPNEHANGVITAFSVKAWDGALASASAVPVSVNVTATNDAPILTGMDILTGATEDNAFAVSYAALNVVSDATDIDGDAFSYRIESVTSGTLTKNGDPVTPGVTLLSSGEQLEWTPAANAFGSLAAFTVRLWDGVASSEEEVTVMVQVAPVADGAIWTGGAGNGNWESSSNWIDQSLPSSADLVIFNGAMPSNAVLDTGHSVQGLSLSGNTAYTFTGSSITIGSGGITTAAPETGSLRHVLNNAVLWNSAATIHTAVDSDLEIGGTLSSSSTLIKSGTGTLLVTGSAAVNGDTTISAGTLQIGNGGTSGSYNGNITNNSSLVFSRGNDFTYAGNLSGGGRVMHSGTGTLTMSGVSSAGELNVTQGGTLSVTGSFSAMDGRIGYGSANGALSLSGSNANVTISNLHLGASSSANLDVSNGAKLSSTSIYIGAAGVGTQSLSITGLGSLLTCGGQINGSASGHLSITNQASATLSKVDTVPTTIDNTTITFSTVTSGNAPFTIGSNGATISVTSDSYALSGAMDGTGALTKTGYGELHIMGVHTRTGDTTIQTGRLRMGQAGFGDASSISIASGARLELLFAGEDTVSEFYLDGVRQAPGTWGSLTSNATFKTSSIVGSGVLHVTQGTVTFESWAIANGLDGSAGKESGMNDDPDRDGVKNMLEFALGSNPLSNRSSGQPVAAVANGYLVLSFNRNDESEDSYLLKLQTSANLSTWADTVIGAASSTQNDVIITVNENGSAPDTISVAIPVIAGTKSFARITVLAE